MLPFASRDNPSASLGSADGGGPIFWGLPQRARTKRDLVLVERPIVIIVGLRATSVPCGVNDPLKAMVLPRFTIDLSWSLIRRLEF
jgi:hypothetical protein